VTVRPQPASVTVTGPSLLSRTAALQSRWARETSIVAAAMFVAVMSIESLRGAGDMGWAGLQVLATRIARQARTAVAGLETVQKQTTELAGTARINDSGVRILHSARALRKVAVGK
jgi:hypothetical protein